MVGPNLQGRPRFEQRGKLQCVPTAQLMEYQLQLQGAPDNSLFSVKRPSLSFSNNCRARACIFCPYPYAQKISRKTSISFKFFTCFIFIVNMFPNLKFQMTSLVERTYERLEIRQITFPFHLLSSSRLAQLAHF